MKKSLLLLQTLFCLFIVWQTNAQLPTLIDTLPAPCGGRVDWGHDPTGSEDAVGFLLEFGLHSCLPERITLRHYAYVVRDKLEVYFQDSSGAWYFQYSTGWHRKMREKTLVIPNWVVNIMFVGSNNLDQGTAWWLGLDCHYASPAECCEIDLNLTGPTDTICPSTQVNLIAHALEGTPPYIFYWNGSNHGSTDSTFTGITGNYSTTFRVKVIDSIGCIGQAVFTVIVPKPPITIPSQLVCPGSWVQRPNVSGLIWQTQDTLVQVFRNITLWGIAIDTGGCEHNIPFRINVQKAPVVSRDTTVCRGQLVTSRAEGVSFLWTDLSGNFLGEEESLETKVVSDTSLVVNITDTLGCLWTDTLSVYQQWCFDSARIYIPNVFMPGSPNGNSIFEVYINPDAQQDVSVKELRIWDRWGGMLYEAEFGMKWSGFCSDGKQAPSTVYIYEIVFGTPEGDRKLFGDVTLLR